MSSVLRSIPRSVLVIVLSALTLGALGSPAHGTEDRAKNVILMIADGAGYNTWIATAMYQGSIGENFYDHEEWTRVAVATYGLCDAPAAADKGPAATEADYQDPTFVYDPQRAWDATPDSGQASGYPYCFAGYRWLRRAPDSANTATALSSGHKTYIGSINTGVTGEPLHPTMASMSWEQGRRVGIVTSVPISHATPAAMAGAHSSFRKYTAAIAREMLTSDLLSVIAGCGNPAFDANGAPRPHIDPSAYHYVGGQEVWEHLEGKRWLMAGDSVAVAFPEETHMLTVAEEEALSEWSLVQTREEIEALRSGETPARLLIVPQTASTLQQGRSSVADARTTEPDEDPLTASVPSLQTLTEVALNALDDGDGGLFLHVEGGAVDWAMHSNQTGRMIEEMADFLHSVQAVIDWVESNSSWEETLLLVTADHDHLLWGPDADTVAFDPLRDRGAGRLPGHRWLCGSHSNSLVPLFARGVGSKQLLEMAKDEDPSRGPYLHQTDVFHLMAAVTRP